MQKWFNMEVIADISWSPVDRYRPVLTAAIRDWVAAILSCSLVLAALFLLARRLAGGLTTPLPALSLVGVALIAIAAALAVHLLCRGSTTDRGPLFLSNALPLLTIFALPVIAIALSLPATAAPGLFVLWITIAIAEIGLWQLRRSRPISNPLRNRSRAARIEPAAPPISLADDSDRSDENLPLPSVEDPLWRREGRVSAGDSPCCKSAVAAR